MCNEEKTHFFAGIAISKVKPGKDSAIIEYKSQMRLFRKELIFTELMVGSHTDL